MANDRRYIARLLGGLLIILLATVLSGCMAWQKEGSKVGIFEGPPTTIGQGSARTFVTLDAQGEPTRIGIKFSDAALAGLPTEPPHGSDGYEYILQLPAEAALAGYNHIGVDWNPKGHIPPGVYDKPHFDFHFYLIGKDARSRITAVGEDLAIAHKAPAAEFMPAGYVLPPGTEVANMGAHAIDPKGDEFTKKSFTTTFIYGFYDGEMIFVEPMMTKAYLESRPDIITLVAVPEKYLRHGYYPIRYAVRYDTTQREYEVSLDSLMRR